MEIESSPIMSLLSRYLPVAGGTMTGDINIGANKIITTNIGIIEYGTNYLRIIDKNNTVSKGLFCERISIGGVLWQSVSGKEIAAPDIDDSYWMVKARDNGVGRVEIARLAGGADPYFQATLPMRLNPTAAALPAVEGMLGYNSVDDTLRIRTASAEVTVAPLKGGSFNITVAADATKVVTHGLGRTPSVVMLIAGQVGSDTLFITNITSTQFTFNRETTGTTGIFYWLAW